MSKDALPVTGSEQAVYASWTSRREATPCPDPAGQLRPGARPSGSMDGGRWST